MERWINEWWMSEINPFKRSEFNASFIHPTKVNGLNAIEWNDKWAMNFNWFNFIQRKEWRQSMKLTRMKRCHFITLPSLSCFHFVQFTSLSSVAIQWRYYNRICLVMRIIFIKVKLYDSRKEAHRFWISISSFYINYSWLIPSFG